MNYIFIDGSYYCFYRYYSLVAWFLNQRENSDTIFPHADPEMIQRFSRLFVKGIQDIPTKLGLNKKIKNYRIFAAKDCERETIWRTQLFPEYKSGRKKCPEIGPYFDLVYNQEKNLFLESGCESILAMNQLEADDCIALTVKQLLMLPSTEVNKIYIFTSDKDYLQLCVSDKVEVMNMHFKKLNEQKSSYADPSCDLFCKIVCGDPSDNIPSVFKKCGPKTALKLYENPDLLEQRFLNEDGTKEKFLFNETLISFDKIPEAFVRDWSALLTAYNIIK